MDYIILSALLSITLLCLLISYDITCQWWKNFGYRMVHYLRHMQLDLNTIEVVTAVPSFHIWAH